MNNKRKMIILRGNSGCGKTTTGKALQQKFGKGTLLVSQDVIRREMLFVNDGPETVAMPLFENLHSAYSNQIYAYYFEMPLEETLRRHALKPNAQEFGEKEMRSWWNDQDFMHIIPEVSIGKESSLNETVELIYNHVNGDKNGR